jgi:hypothetical protein
MSPTLDLMCDINQRWPPEQAIAIGKRVEAAVTNWRIPRNRHRRRPRVPVFTLFCCAK